MKLYKDGEYKLDTFFKKRKALIKAIEPIENEYNYEEMFGKYYKILIHEKYDGFRLPPFIDMSKEIEYFDKQIYLPNDGYYRLVWFIDTLKQKIKEYGIKPVTVPIDILLSASATNDIDPTYLENAACNDQPIIAGILPCLEPSVILIDGNHRLVGKKLKGRETIQAYLLLPQQLVDSIPSNYMRKVAIAHNNIICMAKYMGGMWDKEVFEHSLVEI
ncbi:MAG: hypothetical protein ACRDDX_00950 [Cellulosilyticaceae bacterium]